MRSYCCGGLDDPRHHASAKVVILRLLSVFFFLVDAMCETAHASRQRCACVLFSVRARSGDRQQQVLFSCKSFSIFDVVMCGIPQDSIPVHVPR